MTLNPFDYHKPGPRAQSEMQTLRLAFASLYSLIEKMAGGPSRERSLALTKLEEAAFWANKASVVSDPQSVPE